MSQQREIVLCQPVRTAIGAFNGALKGTPATDLGAAVIRETLRRAGVAGQSVDSVTFGNVIQAGNRMNPARQAAVNGGVAGGMENMDRAPYLLDNGRFGYRMGNAEIHDSMLRDGLDDAFSGKHSGWHTEDLVTQMDITREDLDAFAERSQRRFSEAQKVGKFVDEIVSVEVKGKKGKQLFAEDESPRPDTTLEVLAKLRPAFRDNGTITAGNAPGLNSGAAAMIVADRATAEAKSLVPIARLIAYGV